MSTKKVKRSLLLFTRAPELGKVKTRLQAGLGADQALAIHTRLLSHALQTVTAVDDVQLQVCIAGDMQVPALRDLCDPYPQLRLVAQYDGDLGARMAAAISDALEDADEVVLIGSDCPAIDGEYLQQAFAALAKYPVVIGPASDGGYVLIACRAIGAGDSKEPPDIFSAMPWSEAGLLAATRQRLHALGVAWQELAVRADVDHPSDVPAALRHMDAAAARGQ